VLKAILIAVAVAVIFCILFLIGAAAVKAGDKIVEFTDMEVGDLKVGGFELTEKGKVEIFGVGARAGYSDKSAAYGWIIDADERDLVWSMDDDCDDYSDISDMLAECEGDIVLRPGKYEVYYYVGTPGLFFSDGNISINDLGDLIKIIGDAVKFDYEDNKQFYEDELEELTFIVSTDVPARSYTPYFEEPANVVAAFNRLESDEYHKHGFTLSQELSLAIYAIGEYSDSYELFADCGWIIDADSRKRVWQMDKWNTSRAGGAKKNRMFRDEITLPAGNYIACYATDDSHDFGDWNAQPPYDPVNYGMVITTADPDNIKHVSEYREEELPETEILAMTRIGDDAFEKQGFILKKEARIHIFALGERDYSGDELVDYGWIVNAENLDRVWEMTDDNTDPAGGHVKNCAFDGIIEFPAGDYMVYYRTDGSHASGGWNASPPFRHRDYGISLFGLGSDFSKDDFELVDEFHPGGDLLVNLTGLGDDEELNQRFSLSGATDIRIMAVGEGKSGRMYDYGWIEDDSSGEIIWEMTYRKTKHAGGASKNRMLTANITLKAGNYTACFITDDCHSYRGFNASPPDNPERWGMIITRK